MRRCEVAGRTPAERRIVRTRDGPYKIASPRGGGDQLVGALHVGPGTRPSYRIGAVDDGLHAASVFGTAQTTLPPGAGYQPHALLSSSTRKRPRPSSAKASAWRGLGIPGDSSKTSISISSATTRAAILMAPELADAVTALATSSVRISLALS